MPLTMDGLKKLVEGAGLRYFVDPERPVLLLGATGMFGTFQFVVSLGQKDEFLQFRTINYLRCLPGHPHFTEVLKTLGVINYTRRLVKFGWDPQDGEIVGYVDLWVMDSTVTESQFNTMLSCFLPSIDTACDRIKKTMDTGHDPGDPDPQRLLEEAAKSGSVPPEIRELLDKVRGKKDTSDSKKPAPEISEI